MENNNYADLRFTEEFVSSLFDKIPTDLKKCPPNNRLKLEKNMGYVRFEDDILVAVYIFSSRIRTSKKTDEEIKYREECEMNICTEPGTLLKFDLVDNDFVFSSVYMGESQDEEFRYEHRYNVDMELISKYKHYLKPPMLDNGDVVICEKYEDNGKKVKIRYTYSYNAKDYSKQIKYLEKENIINNKNGQKARECCYGNKKIDGKEILYLVMGKYFID
tara:strand:- start:243 stop:896 length:654 start_codon:yes stop_codon:yes gene_type:complete